MGQPAGLQADAGKPAFRGATLLLPAGAMGAAGLLSLCAPATPLPAAAALRPNRTRCPPHPNRPARPNRPQDEYGSPHLHQLIISLPCPHPHQARKIRQALVKMGFHPPGSEGAAAAAAAAAAPAPAPATEHKPAAAAAAATAAPAAAPAPVAAAAVAPPPAGYPPPAVAAAPAPYPPPPGGAPMPYGAPPAPVPYGAAPPAYAYPRECHPSCHLAAWSPRRAAAVHTPSRPLVTCIMQPHALLHRLLHGGFFAQRQPACGPVLPRLRSLPLGAAPTHQPCIPCPPPPAATAPEPAPPQKDNTGKAVAAAVLLTAPRR